MRREHLQHALQHLLHARVDESDVVSDLIIVLLRQRVSRLVRENLSFSKTLANHIGAINYFFCHYELMQAAALHR